MSTKEVRRGQRPNSLVGRRVAFQAGQPLQGVVVDERGPIGHNKEMLLTVHVRADPDEPLTFVLPESLVSLVESDEPPRSIEPAETIRYLQHGGLVSLLRANSGGGRDQPRAWLVRNSLGNVTHSFVSRGDGIGGALIPCGALHDERVFAPKQAEVACFVQSFGLSDRQAEEVLEAVGVDPK